MIHRKSGKHAIEQRHESTLSTEGDAVGDYLRPLCLEGSLDLIPGLAYQVWDLQSMDKLHSWMRRSASPAGARRKQTGNTKKVQVVNKFD